MRRLTILLVLLATSPAQAAWTPPVRLGRPAESPQLVMARDGHALLVGHGRRGSQVVALAPGGMEPLARRTVSDHPYFLTYGRNRTLGFRSSEGAIFGSVTDPFARSEPMSGAWSLSVNGRGDAVAMWGERRGRVLHTRYAVRPAGGRFTKPSTVAVARRYSEFWGTLGSGEIGAAAVIDGRRTVTIALHHESDGRMRRRREVRVVTIPWGGRPGRQETLGPDRGFGFAELEVAPSGRTVIAWKSTDGGEEVNMPVEIWAATRGPGARRFRPAQRLEANGGIPIASSGYFDLAVGRDGEALATWSTCSRRTGRYVVEAASAPPGARFGRSRAIAPDGIHVDAAVGPDGRAAVAWVSRLDDNPQDGLQAFAALRPDRSAHFGAPAPVSAVERAESPEIAYDSTTGHPLIVWSGAPDAPPGDDADGLTGPRTLSFARFVP